MPTPDRNLAYRFRRSVNAIQHTEDTVLVGSNHRNFVELRIGDTRLANALAALAQGKELGSITDSLSEESPLVASQFLGIVEGLLSRGLLEPRLDEACGDDLRRFDRQILFFRDTMKIGFAEALAMQRKIGQFRVGVLGIGGVGSYVVRTLASMGFGRIAVLDHDHVEESNISRQVLYDYRDIGRKKVDVVAEKIPHISPGTEVVCFDKSVEALRDIECVVATSDLIVCAIDTPKPAVYDIVAQIPFKFGIPTVYGGSVADNISVGPTVSKGKSRCLKCVRGIEQDVDAYPAFDFVKSIRSTYTTTLIDPINALAASFMSIEAVKVASNFSEPMYDKSLLINLDSYTSSLYEPLSAGNGCKVCNGDMA